jgi:hypothetical protein
MLKINSITEVNHDGTLMLDVNYCEEKQLLFVTLENGEISCYSILDTETCEDNYNWTISDKDFVNLNSYLYERNFISNNEQDLVIDNYEYMHRI